MRGGGTWSVVFTRASGALNATQVILEKSASHCSSLDRFAGNKSKKENKTNNEVGKWSIAIVQGSKMI
jgi:hypothetical protein